MHVTNEQMKKLEEIKKYLKNLSDVNARQSKDSLDMSQMLQLNQEIDKINLAKSKTAPGNNISEASEYSLEELNIDSDFDLEGKEEEIVNQTIGERVQKNLSEKSTIRQLCSSIFIDKDNVDIPRAVNKIDCSWSSGKSVAASTDAFEFNSVKTFELSAQPKITQKMLDDSEINIEEFLVNQLSNLFLKQEDEAFLNGDGYNMPNGILKNSNIDRVKMSDLESYSLQENDLLNLFYALPSEYSHNAKFLMNQSMVHKIRTLKDPATGQHYWNPGLMFDKTDTLFGLPLLTNAAMSNSIESGEDLILYGDFKQCYQIVDRKSIAIQKDPYSSKPFVIYYTTKQVGGSVVDAKSVVSLQA